MQLDRFTEKAQETVVAAQQLAERLQSPVLDAEHLLAALVEPDDGVPAETLRRLGVDLAAFRGELAAILARRARIQGGPGPRPSGEAGHGPGPGGGPPARRRVHSTEHLLLGAAEVGGEGQQLLDGTAPAARPSSTRSPRSAAASASPRRTPRAPTRRSRSTAAT